ncbi:MAG: prephenate dehydratase [Ignavibacteriales bacterium]|nr:prephenate dehydratase [Ignavibacteriales bacterium]
MNSKDIRNKIDHLDTQIVNLLHQRMEYALQAGKHKESVIDPEREQKILHNVTSQEFAVLDHKFIIDMFKAIMTESRELQTKNMKLVGFQGEHGAWSEIAIHKLSHDMVAIPCFEFNDVFSGVVNKELDCGLVPIENSIEGSVNEVNDLLIESDLKITGEIIIPIHHNLLALPGVDHQEIRAVYSHPQALAQCRSFLYRNKLEARPFFDTAGAARWLRNEGQRSAGVIASSLAADIHGLEIVKENIEDNHENSTRFVLLSLEEIDGDSDKCTISFSTRHHVGALFDILKVFADNQINLTRIESRPIRKNPGAFGFLIDFQVNPEDSKVLETIKKVERLTADFKNLGFYKGAKI